MESNNELDINRDLELEASDAEGVKGGGLNVNVGDISVGADGRNLDVGIGSTQVHTGEDGWSANAGQGRSSAKAKGGWGRAKGLGKRIRRH